MRAFSFDRPRDVPPRPLPASYWVLPGRFLVGEYPGSQSRAEAMDRVRSMVRAGVTCFVDLTEPREMPAYDGLLPYMTPTGRKIEYLREPIPDHGVPSKRDAVRRLITAIDEALAANHVVYLHCRAGIGRSAMVAGCWLAARPDAEGEPLDRLQQMWQQSERSESWPAIPETAEQADYVRNWMNPAAALRPVSHGRGAADAAVAERIRGALIGLAIGDAAGEGRALKRPPSGGWTQHTALALCLAESLLEVGHCDARDQMERYLRWQREGHLSARGQPGRATADVARALATYQWRGLPMAGSHDPRDHTTSSLPRVASAVAYSVRDPVAAVALASECSRTTHQSPVVLDACRYYAALLLGAIGGAARDEVLAGPYEPVPGLWKARPLRPEILAAANGPPLDGKHRGRADVLSVLPLVRAAVAGSTGVPDAVQYAIEASREPALAGALAGSLAGAFTGAAAIPATATAGLPGLDRLEEFATRLAAAALAAPAREGPAS